MTIISLCFISLMLISTSGKLYGIDYTEASEPTIGNFILATIVWSVIFIPIFVWILVMLFY